MNRRILLQPQWLPSAKAAERLGLSKTSLRRYADAGILVEGEHYRRGLFPRSPWRWEVVGVADALEKHAARPSRPEEVSRGGQDQA